jgi:hypothetical protein
LEVEVNGGTDFTGASPAVTINAGSSDSLVVSTQFTPSAVGAYVIHREITSTEVDDVPSNNTLTDITMNVTNFVYARDNNTPSGSTQNGTDGFEAGNYFDIWADQDIYAINTRLATGTAVNEEIYAKLYIYNTTSGEFDYVTETLPMYVAANQINTNLIMAFTAPVTLTANNTYLACVGSFGPGLRVANAGTSEPQTSFFLDHADGEWYYQTNTPLVRMNFDPSASLAENNANVSIGNVYPNPTTGNTTINYSLENASEVAVSIVDVTGKSIYTSNEGVQTTGAHKVAFDAASFSNGVYYVTLTSGESTVTKKFIKK